MPSKQRIQTRQPEAPDKAWLRWFFIPTPPAWDQTFPATVSLMDPTQVHYAQHVVRLRAGDIVAVVDPILETAYRGEVGTVDRQVLQLTLLGPLALSPRSPMPHLILGAALVKGERWDWTLQKATELGVREIVPLLSERTVVRVKDPETKLARWQEIVTSAARQSEGLFIPTIHPPCNIDTFFLHHLGEPDSIQDPLKDASAPNLNIILAEFGETRRPLRELIRGKTPQQIRLLVGPEGGWTENELARFESQGFEAAVMGDRILRSETAVTAALACCLYEYDRPHP